MENSSLKGICFEIAALCHTGKTCPEGLDSLYPFRLSSRIRKYSNAISNVTSSTIYRRNYNYNKANYFIHLFLFFHWIFFQKSKNYASVNNVVIFSILERRI